MKADSYIKVLRSEKQYCLMLYANLISRFGDSLDAIAYSWMVYGLTGSKSWLAITFGVNMIPTILLMPFSGALTEFFDKKKIVVFCDIMRGLVVCLTGLLLLMNLLKPWQLLILTFSNSCFEALRIPSSLAIIPHILGKENYKTAMSFNQGASRVAELVGLGAAGAVIGLIGTGGALLVDAATFLVSGLLLSFLKLREQKQGIEVFHVKKYFETLMGGFTYFKKSSIAVMVCVVCVVLNITAVPIENLQAAYVSEYLQLDVMAMSVGSIAMTVGAILGAFLLPWISKAFTDRKILIQGGLLIGFLYFGYTGVGMAELAVSKYVLYSAATFAFGFINSLIGITVQVLLMSRVPEELIGRIGSIFNALACSSLPVCSFLLAAASSVLSISQMYMGMGVITILLFLWVGRLKGMKEIETE